MSKSPKVSIVIPLFNEEANVLPLMKQLQKVAKKIGSHEIIFVDDGSTDKTFSRLTEIARTNKKVKVISFRRNFGQTAALMAGFENSHGEVIVTLDGDLQNDPADIPKLLKKLDDGYDLVCGWRKKRKDNKVRTTFSQFANSLIRQLSGIPVHDSGCTLKAYRADLVKELHLYGEMHRFIPAVAAQIGARITEIPVKHHPRKRGKSKYGLDRTFRVILDVILIKFLLTFQNRPLHLFGSFGMISGFFGSVVFLYLIYEKFINNMPLSERPLFLVSIFMIMLGVQFITIGILAEMLMRVYYESQGKKTYYVRERIADS